MAQRKKKYCLKIGNDQVFLTVRTWNHDLEVMIWPPQSADLNPIEHLWTHLKARLCEYETPASWIAELWKQVQTEWEAIPASVCQNLIKGMPSRVEAVLKANRDDTKY